MRIFWAVVLIVISVSTVSKGDEADERTLVRLKHKQRKSKRFNFPGGMSMGGSMSGGGGSPFHAGGPGQGSGMSGMNPMGGSMPHGAIGGGPMHGPQPGGGMGSSIRGPSSPGHTSMFNPANCLTHDVVCPPWCLMVDEFGCRSCPCGPGGGMVTGMSSFMTHMPSIGGSSFSHVSQSSGSTADCIAVSLCKSTCPDNYVLGQMGSDGCPKCSCSAPVGLSGGGVPGGAGFGGGGNVGGSSGSSGTGSAGFGSPFSAGGGSGPSMGSGPFAINGGMVGSHSGSSGSQISTSTNNNIQTTYVVSKPKECRIEEVCRQTCGGKFELGEYGSDGCRTCVCPPKEVVTYKPALTEIVQPVEQIQVQTLSCRTPSCSYGCSIGYKCGVDGCPTCECAKPSGYQVHEVVIQHQLQCTSTFTCSTSCEIGYKCGPDGCPTCECLVGYVQPPSTGECYDCEWIDFLEPTPEPVMVSYVKPRPQTVYVTGTTNECHNCETTQPEVIYTQPKPETHTVYVTGTNECHNCETTQPEIVYQKPQPVYITQPQYTKPETQTVYVPQPECTDCGRPKPQTVYVERPQPQTVYVQKPKPEPVYVTQPQTVYVQKPKPEPVYVTEPQPQQVYLTGTQTECHNCGTSHQTVLVEKPKPQTQTALVTQPHTQTECHNCGSTALHTGGSSSGGLLSILTSGTSSGAHYAGSSGSGSGGIPYGITGGSSYGGSIGHLSGSAVGGMGSSSGHYTGGMIGFNSGGCPPMPHDCDPSCIKWDEPHCRRCECENPFPQYSGLARG